MAFKLVRSVLVIGVLVFSFSATAQDSGDAKEKLAMVKSQIEETTKENEDLKAQLSDIQAQIDELKRESEQKEEEIKELKEKSGD